MSHLKEKTRFCSLPVSAERQYDAGIDPGRLSLLRTIDRKWVNGTILRYAFFDDHATWKGSDAFKRVVDEAFKVWQDVGIGVNFKRVDDLAEAEVRIGFEQDGRSWSMLGRDVLNSRVGERTMNLGWDITMAGPNGLDTVLHEIGHTLGFPHEHQNPNAGLVWDEAAVYEEFMGPPNNWGRDMIHWNILRVLSKHEFEGSLWDHDSIMHYSFPSGLIIRPEQYKTQPLIPEAGLSEIDKAAVRLFYPELDIESFEEIEPFTLKLIHLKPAEQVNYLVKTTVTRKYNFRTFGFSDTVMVLFEGRDDPRYLIGADDTGIDLNASFTFLLEQGKEYILRLRLYWKDDSGNTALIMW